MNPALTLLKALLVLGMLVQQNGDLENRARKIVTAFLSGDMDATVAMFKSTGSSANLRQAHDQLIAKTGPFKTVTSVQFSKVQELQFAKLSCDFVKGNADLTVSFNEAGDIVGFRITSIKTKPIPWDPPQYGVSAKFTERELALGSPPWQLPAILTVPKGTGPFPGVVLVHGSGAHDEDETIGGSKPFKDLAWGLASNGIAVLRYKKRNAVYDQQMVALNITVMDETVDDARAGIALLAQTDGIDRKRIFVIGHSLGGMLGPRIVSGTAATGLIIMAGNTRPIQDLIVEQIEHMKADGLVPQAAVDSVRESRTYIQGDLEPSTRVMVAGATTPGSYWLDLRTYDPAKSAATLNLPMFIIQGDRDYQVGKADYEGWQKALDSRPNVKFKMYPRLNHLFISGDGPASPKEYDIPGHVASEVILDLSNWINGARK
jgi:dienelactone hydrolase